MKRNFKLGLSLIEVVIAMAIVVVVAVALVSTTIFTQKTSRSASAQIQAAKLAEENIEQLRVLRDRKGFDALHIRPCSILNASTSDIMLWNMDTACSSMNEDSWEQIQLDNVLFRRKIAVCVNPGPFCNGSVDTKAVTVTVSWQEPGGTRSVSSVTYFSKSPGGT